VVSLVIPAREEENYLNKEPVEKPTTAFINAELIMNFILNLKLN
jgi:hypothetical protein